MRLWSLFCEGNKTSDVPQLTNNYLCCCCCCKAPATRAAISQAQKWEHCTACGGGERSVCVREDNFCHSIEKNNNELFDCPEHARQNPLQVNCPPVFTLGWGLSGTVYLTRYNKNILLIWRAEVKIWITVKNCNVLKCLYRCSSLFFPSCSDHTFLWHTQRKGEPIIISAANDGFWKLLWRCFAQKI